MGSILFGMYLNLIAYRSLFKQLHCINKMAEVFFLMLKNFTNIGTFWWIYQEGLSAITALLYIFKKQ